MRHGRWGRAHGWASVPPTASQSIATSSVDAVWGSGHHHETRMRGTGSVPPQHATSCHAVACRPRRRRATCACHTKPYTHPPGGRGGGARGVGTGGERACSESCRPPAKSKIDSRPPRERGSCSGRRWLMADEVGGCCTHGRCPSTHTPHTHTPHAHTLGQHIGYEGGQSTNPGPTPAEREP